jgi:hypothetical protein
MQSELRGGLKLEKKITLIAGQCMRYLYVYRF